MLQRMVKDRVGLTGFRHCYSDLPPGKADTATIVRGGLIRAGLDLTPALTRSSALDLSPLQIGEGEGEPPTAARKGVRSSIGLKNFPIEHRQAGV